MYRNRFLVIGCFHLILISISRVNGMCSELYQTVKIQECENMLQLTNFDISSNITKTVNAWRARDLKNICRYKYKLEMCYELIMLQCSNYRTEIHKKLEYIHDTFNYLCNGRIQTYIDVLPCLNSIDTSPAVKNCNKITSHYHDECIKIDKMTKCVGNWTSRSCGSNAGHFMKILLESELSLNLLPERCDFNSKGEETKCSMNNIDTKTNVCGSLICFSDKDFRNLLINPLPKLNQKKLHCLCDNLKNFQSCSERIQHQCSSMNKALILRYFYYIDIFQYICKQTPKDLVNHSQCQLSNTRKACLIEGRRKMLRYKDSEEICSTVEGAIQCSSKVNTGFCSKDHNLFMEKLYRYAFRTTLLQHNCLNPIEIATKPTNTTTQDDLFSIIVASVSAVSLLIFALFVGIYMSFCKERKKGLRQAVSIPSNIITRPSFVTPLHLPPYNRYENNTAPPPYDERMAEEFRASNRF